MAEQVLAAVQVAPEQTELREFPLPDVPADGALLKVEAAGVCGSDVGGYKRFGRGPRILGHENVGFIARAGEAFARRWGVKEGDRVAIEEYLPCGYCELCLRGEFRHCAATDVHNNPAALRYGNTPIDTPPALWGGYSQYLYMPPATVLHKMPAHVPPDQSAMALPLGNGVQWAVVEAQAGPGRSIVVLGPGQQGLGGVLAAKAAGADLVILVGLSQDARRLEVGRQIGADHAIVADQEDVRERVQEITGGRGVDAAIDTTSAPSAEMVPLMIDVVKRKEGRIVVQSIGGTVPDFPLEKMARKYITMKAARGHSYASVELAIHRIASGKYPLELLCTHSFGLNEVDLAIKSTGGTGPARGDPRDGSAVTRTRVDASWVVGYNGAAHELLHDASVVYEDDQVIAVGHRFDGPVDRTIDGSGMLVMPGLINCHLHLGSNAPHTFFLDHTRADYFGANFYSYAVPRRGVSDPRAANRTDVDALFGLWSAIRGGATTVLDIGTRNAPDLVRLVGELGARVYVGPSFKSFSYVWDERGQLQFDPDVASGSAGLKRALDFAAEYDGAHDGRVRCMLYPAQLDTCSVDLLKEARAAATANHLRISLHAAMNMVEFHKILGEHGRTPLELLDHIGFLGPDVLLGHCVFHTGHSWAHYPYPDDLRLLADSGASVAHAPYKYAKMGVMLESLERYRRIGINVALGTDTFPQDLISEMRLAGLMCRFADGSFRVGSAHDVFDAATLGGARALGRDDLGRLAPGSKADLVLVNLRAMHFGAVRDPIKSLVECGSASDIDTVVINGRTLVADGQAVSVDETTLLAAVQASGERAWASAADWHRSGATVDEISPLSYPLRT